MSRSGLDGLLLSKDGDPWLSAGRSAWEVSVDSDETTKANEDYKKRTRETDQETRQQSTFVAVTARKWTTKDKWLSKKLTLLDAARAEQVMDMAAAFTGQDVDDFDRELIRNELREKLHWHLSYGKNHPQTSLSSVEIARWLQLHAALAPLDSSVAVCSVLCPSERPWPTGYRS